MTPDQNGILHQPKVNDTAPETTLQQPENTSAAHNVGQYAHITRIQGYCSHGVLGGCDEDGNGVG